MVGLGETLIELLQTMQDIRDTSCDILTIGQYLSPSARHLPIQRYYTPEEFEELKDAGIEMGFRHVESGSISTKFLSCGGTGAIIQLVVVRAYNSSHKNASRTLNGSLNQFNFMRIFSGMWYTNIT